MSWSASSRQRPFAYCEKLLTFLLGALARSNQCLAFLVGDEDQWASRSLSVTKTLTDNGFEATIDLVISLTHCDTKRRRHDDQRRARRDERALFIMILREAGRLELLDRGRRGTH